MPEYISRPRDAGEEREAGPKVVRKPERQEILECPADGCGESRGRIERVEVYPGESVAILLRCNQGHWWWMSIDERRDELLYTVRAARTWPAWEE